jgi:hypothetical protein
VGARAREGVTYDPEREHNVPLTCGKNESEAAGESGASRRTDRAARGGRGVGADFFRN